MKSMWVLVVALTSGPLAASAADEFYVIQDISTKQCAIVESPPTTTDVKPKGRGTVDKPDVRAKSIFANSQPSAFVPREHLSSF